VAEIPTARQDPFVILGLDDTASIDDVFAARRDLARSWHPDLGGDAQQMAAINDAVRRCVAVLNGAANPHQPSRRNPATDSVFDVQPDSAGGETYPFPGQESYVDHPSFRVEALPAEAHEALRIVSSWIGEVVTDEPPYLLECLLNEPVKCWCQFHLLPEAGSSMVGLRVAGVDDSPRPSVRQVRDYVINALNELDWEDLDASWR
jgi:hypothetical protein